VAIGYWAGGSSTSSLSLKLEPDGSVSVLTGMVDMSGTRTAMQQLCAEELGLDSVDDVRITYGDTDVAQYNDVTAASRTTYSMSVAIHHACQKLLAEVRELAATRFGVGADQVDWSDGRFSVIGEPDRGATVKDLAPRQGVSVSASVSQRRFHPEASGGIADVEVDPETGKVTVLRYTAFQDVGLAINPTRIEAQMQGGVAQGVGWALTEELLYNKRGAIRNASLLDYRMLVARDLPMIDTVIVEVPTGEEPFPVRGAGEVAIVAPASVIANAVQSAAGARTFHMPMNPERLFWAIRKQRDGNGASPPLERSVLPAALSGAAQPAQPPGAAG
jgi:CO/xanthine dehydrogenase Mo-binding subunit